MTSDWTEYIPTGDGIDIHVDESMSLHTTYKVGGAARVFIRL